MRHRAVSDRSRTLGWGSGALLAPGGPPRYIVSPTGRKTHLSLVCGPARVPGCVAAWKECLFLI